jgi:hypothetical protein
MADDGEGEMDGDDAIDDDEEGLEGNDDDDDDDAIKYAYTNPSSKIAFSGISNIKRHFPNKKVEEIKNILAEIPTYTLHREAKKVKTRNPFFIYVRRQQIQIDLIDMSNLARWNDGVTFLLVAIDCATKKAWTRTQLNKSGVTTLASIRSIITAMETPMKSIFFDRGREFVNTNVRDALRRAGIKIHHPNSELKAAIAERFNRSLQDLIFKYMTHHETRRYVDVLQALMQTYNTRGHRTLKYMSPNEADLVQNRHHVISALNDYYTKVTSTKVKPRFAVGDTVRIRRELTVFLRGYHERFKREQFEVVAVERRMPIPTFTIKSLDTGDIISGSFYNNELQKVLGDTYKVEKVLKRRVRNGKVQLYVKWLDFNARHNSWIDADDVTETYDGENG